MSEFSELKKFSKRCFDYANNTNLDFVSSDHDEKWEELKIPSMRGFTPHLRQVRLYKKQKPRDSLWFLHDLLHIMFYDFAFCHLGWESVQDIDRLYEVHLASEAFAVLSLDYQVLSLKKNSGLAVDIFTKDWPAFQKLNSKLPPMQSFEFADLLLDFYLSGNAAALETQKGNAKYNSWLGHEIRYGNKQRAYVKMLVEDLQQIEFSNSLVSLEGSSVAEPLWELLSLLVYSNDREWLQYIEFVKSKSLPRNYFKNFSKYKDKLERVDFRMTDYRALPFESISQKLVESPKPNASDLFLLWQIISSLDFNKVPKALHRKLSQLVVQSQTNKVDEKIWRSVWEFAANNLKEFISDQSLRECFYLP